MLESYTDEELDEILERQKKIIYEGLNYSLWDLEYTLLLLFKLERTGEHFLLEVTEWSINPVAEIHKNAADEWSLFFLHAKNAEFQKLLNLPIKTSFSFSFEPERNRKAFLELLNRETLLHLEFVKDDDSDKFYELWNRYQRLRNA